MVKRASQPQPGVSRRALLATTVVGGLALAEIGGSAAASERALHADPAAPRRETPFDADWRFIRADIPGAEDPAFDHSSWSHVTLPYDWSIEDLPGSPKTTAPWTAPAALWTVSPTQKADPFAPATIPPSVAGGPPLEVGPFNAVASAGGGNTGWVVGGTAWYRKSFLPPRRRPGERLELRFDGAFQATEVWLNGKRLGANFYGYGAFTFDLTDQIFTDRLNILAVRVRNEGETSRWYSGSGLYRHAWLTVTGPVRVAPWGLSVRTPQIDAASATARVEIEIDNTLPTDETVSLKVVVRGPGGDVVADATSRALARAHGRSQCVLELRLSKPRLWAPHDPALYETEVVLSVGATAMDQATARFGVRSIAVSPDKGLLINGAPTKLKGACIHADNGILGANAIDRAEIRKVELLKGYGYNALRMGHQMFSPAFMDACDEAGMLLISEVFDTWEQAKWLKNDYSRLFDENWKNDIARMVRQNRNHPSVIFWSIGNEIPEAAEPRGVQIAAQLRSTVLALDPSRPITAAIANTFGAEGEPARRSLDVAGYNYALAHYEADHKTYPGLVIMGTEQWSREMHDGWRKAEASPWVLGEFVWSGMDYLGEVGSGSSELRKTGDPAPTTPVVIGLWDYPAYLSGCGEIDINGGRKPQGLYRDVLWDRSALELLVQRPTPPGTYERISDWGWHDELESWTWPEADGRPLTVRTYTSGDRVKLVLNGRDFAERYLTGRDRLKAEFEVPYAPGVLVAIAYRAGAEIGRKTLETVGPPAKLRLRVERTRIQASQNDLGYVIVEICDAQGRKTPDATLPVSFSATGAARLRATGSANPRGLKSFRDPQCTTFHGEALAIVQPFERRGECRIRATAAGLADAEAVIQVG